MGTKQTTILEAIVQLGVCHSNLQRLYWLLGKLPGGQWIQVSSLHFIDSVIMVHAFFDAVQTWAWCKYTNLTPSKKNKKIQQQKNTLLLEWFATNPYNKVGKHTTYHSTKYTVKDLSHLYRKTGTTILAHNATGDHQCFFYVQSSPLSRVLFFIMFCMYTFHCSEETQLQSFFIVVAAHTNWWHLLGAMYKHAKGYYEPLRHASF